MKAIERLLSTFGNLPQVVDRLFNEDSGMIVQDCSVDGGLMMITFTLST